MVTGLLTGVRRGRDHLWQNFLPPFSLWRAWWVVFGLVTTVIGVPKHDHGRDQSKPCTFEFFFENFVLHFETMHSHHIHHMTKHLNNKRNSEKGSKTCIEHNIHAFTYTYPYAIHKQGKHIARLTLVWELLIQLQGDLNHTQHQTRVFLNLKHNPWNLL